MRPTARASVWTARVITALGETPMAVATQQVVQPSISERLTEPRNMSPPA
jgi:hypothetical protein